MLRQKKKLGQRYFFFLLFYLDTFKRKSDKNEGIHNPPLLGLFHICLLYGGGNLLLLTTRVRRESPLTRKLFIWRLLPCERWSRIHALLGVRTLWQVFLGFNVIIKNTLPDIVSFKFLLKLYVVYSWFFFMRHAVVILFFNSFFNSS